MSRIEATQSSWAKDLIQLGYNDDISPPSLLVQVLLTQIQSKEFHDFVIQYERGCTDDNESLLINLDVSMWLELAGNGKPLEKALSYKGQLMSILKNDYTQMEQCLNTLKKFEMVLREAKVEGIIDPSEMIPPIHIKAHPLFQGKDLCEEAAVMVNDDDEEQINEEISPDKFKEYVYPIIPNRVLEDMTGAKNHKMWTMWSLQLVAPFSIDTLITLTAVNGQMDPQEFKSICYREALNNVSSVQGEIILEGITMQTLDAARCSKPVKLYSKGKIPPLMKRTQEYYKSIWNYNRPFIKCTCSQDEHCPKRNIMWFDQVLWFVANNIDTIFNTSDKLEVQFVSFAKWLLKESTAKAIKAVIVFMYMREFMIIAAEEYSEKKTRLLQEHGPWEGPKYIEQLFLPQEFSIQLARSNKRSTPAKRYRLDLNETSTDFDANAELAVNTPIFMSTRGRGRRRGCGARFSTPQFSHNRGYTPGTNRGHGNFTRQGFFQKTHAYMGSANQNAASSQNGSSNESSPILVPLKLKYQ